jgi:hypothetical protein
MTFRLVHAAGNQFFPQNKRLGIIATASRNSDIFTLSEANKDHGAINALLGFDNHTIGELSIGWRTAKFTVVDKGARQVMVGGKRGDGSPGDRRRRGPNRWVAWVVLNERATGKDVLIATHHAIARADTQHKWRRPLRAQGFLGTVNELRAARARHRDAQVILTGDLNTVGAITAFVTLGVREVKTPATFGRNRYDRIYSTDTLTNLTTFATGSDHKALGAIVTLGNTTTPLPAAPDAPVGPPPKVQPHLNRRQRRRLRRLERMVRRGRRLRPYQRRALARLRRLRRNR